ncbi:unnamed protein product [Blepharisma stoltei]|uniref:Maturase K n=1 Tax=Blepharisma stoltei TaxID=1481888 RepID=A0AAU9JZ85_9CILI|nr:unnamed protein product [Blepharisma stoltei]
MNHCENSWRIYYLYQNNKSYRGKRYLEGFYNVYYYIHDKIRYKSFWISEIPFSLLSNLIKQKSKNH